MWRGRISVSSATWTVPRIKCSIKILNSLQTIRNFFPGLVSGGLVSTQKADFWWKQRRHLCNFSIVGSIPQQIPALSFFFLLFFHFKHVFLLLSHLIEGRLTRSAEMQCAGNHCSTPGYKTTITIKIKHSKINPGMDVGNQLLKPEVVLDWGMIGERAPATEHAKQLHIHPAFPGIPVPHPHSQNRSSRSLARGLFVFTGVLFCL